MWMLTRLSFRSFRCVRECVIAEEREYVCMHAHTSCRGAAFYCRIVLTSHIYSWKKKHSCCLVTSLWLYIIYYTFLLLRQTFTKYDILYLLLSLCIIQSRMPYLASTFCIDVLLHFYVIVFVLGWSFCLYVSTALVMCIIFKNSTFTLKFATFQTAVLIHYRVISHSLKHKWRVSKMWLFSYQCLKNDFRLSYERLHLCTKLTSVEIDATLPWISFLADDAMLFVKGMFWILLFSLNLNLHIWCLTERKLPKLAHFQSM